MPISQRTRLRSPTGSHSSLRGSKQGISPVSGSNLEVQTNIDPINLVFTIVNNNESIATFGMLLVQANP